MLARRRPDAPWSVRNQARIHRRNGDRPYRSGEDALRHRLETPTAVAMRRTATGSLEPLAPFGLDDLFGLVVRPTPHARRHRLAAYGARMADKGWPSVWPKLRVEVS